MAKKFDEKYFGRCLYRVAIEDSSNATGQGLISSAKKGSEQAVKCVYNCLGTREDAVGLDCFCYHELMLDGEVIRDTRKGFICVGLNQKVFRQNTLGELEMQKKELKDLGEVEKYLSPEGLVRLGQLKVMLGKK